MFYSKYFLPKSYCTSGVLQSSKNLKIMFSSLVLLHDCSVRNCLGLSFLEWNIEDIDYFFLRKRYIDGLQILTYTPSSEVSLAINTYCDLYRTWSWGSHMAFHSWAIPLYGDQERPVPVLAASIFDDLGSNTDLPLASSSLWAWQYIPLAPQSSSKIIWNN